MLSEGKYAEAEVALRQSVQTFARENFDGLQSSTPLYYLVILYSRRGDFAAAKEFARQYYEVVLKDIGPDHLAAAEGKLLWARYRADTGEIQEAVEQALEAMPVFELGTALEGEKKHRESADTLERAAKIYERLGPTWVKRAGEIRKMIPPTREGHK